MNAKLLFLSCLAVAHAGFAHGVSLSEPATVFYGQVTNPNSGGQIVNEGALVWTINGPDNVGTVLQATLAKHDEGRYSYFIEIPHHALATGLTAPANTVALGTQPQAYQHLAITVDGRPATIIVPGEDHFDLTTAARAATYRLDLSVALPVTDTDGDGLPDWWEELHGLDPEANDAGLDPDGDGVSNLNEFLRGTGPGLDNRGPELLTTNLLAYAGATTGVLLRTADLDSTPAHLTYTVVSLPASGTLSLRGPEEKVALSAGDTFTQADVGGGRLVFEHALDEDTMATKFRLRVRDENAGHAPSEGEIEIIFYDPLETTAPTQWVTAATTGLALDNVAAERQRRMRDAVLGREFGYVVWDLAEASHDMTLTQPADGEAHAITGGTGKDSLSGGPANDFIAGGANDDLLTGGAGVDRFLLLGANDGRDRITDFNPAEGDVLDVGAALSGTSPLLTNYLRLQPVAGGSTLGIDANGDGSGYTDLVITLENYPLPDTEALYTLVENGNIVAGSLALPPLISIAATDALASETGPNTGTFTITRRGSTTEALTVSLQGGGSATNGVDYSSLPGSVTIPAGAASVAVTVSPFADSLNEVAEVVELSLIPSSSYALGSATFAQITIENLKPQLWVETLVPVAAVAGGQKGIFLIQRGGDTGSSVLVRINLSGTARSGSDFETLPTFLSFAPQQTFALVEVTPRAGAELAGGAATVILTIASNAAYERAEPSSAEILIVPERLDLETWRTRNFPGGTGSANAFAGTDPGATGLSALLRYAFGLDPANPRATAGHLPAVTIEGDHLMLRYHEERAAVDLDYVIEVSGDLRTWRAAAALEMRRMPLVSETPFLQSYRSVETIAETDFRYLRVRILRP